MSHGGPSGIGSSSGGGAAGGSAHSGGTVSAKAAGAAKPLSSANNSDEGERPGWSRAQSGSGGPWVRGRRCFGVPAAGPQRIVSESGQCSSSRRSGAAWRRLRQIVHSSSGAGRSGARARRLGAGVDPMACHARRSETQRGVFRDLSCAVCGRCVQLRVHVHQGKPRPGAPTSTATAPSCGSLQSTGGRCVVCSDACYDAWCALVFALMCGVL